MSTIEPTGPRATTRRGRLPRLERARDGAESQVTAQLDGWEDAVEPLRVILGYYQTRHGRRTLFQERMRSGTIRIIDVPDRPGPDVRTHLVEPALATREEVDAVAADYLQRSSEHRTPALLTF